MDISIEGKVVFDLPRNKEAKESIITSKISSCVRNANFVEISANNVIKQRASNLIVVKEM
jgi:hypothetical protein